MAQQPQGGSFAPPLTDELLAKYRTQIDALPVQSAVRDAMEKLYRCCSVWWELPESTGKSKPHQSGRGAIQDLDKPIADALWDHIPWSGEKLDDGTTAPNEIKAYGELFHAIELPQSVRNAAKMEAWREAVRAALEQSLLSGGSVQALRDRVDFHTSVVALTKRYAGEWSGKVVSAIVAVVFPGSTLEAAQKQYGAFSQAYDDAMRPGAASPVPRPVLEPTLLRDAAYHLLWHAAELALDREPISMDKL